MHNRFMTVVGYATDHNMKHFDIGADWDMRFFDGDANDERQQLLHGVRRRALA